MQPGLLDRDVLEWLIFSGSVRLKTAADAGLGVGVGDLAVGEQLHLLQLLLRAVILLEQGVDLPLDGRVGGLTGRLPAPPRRWTGSRPGRAPPPTSELSTSATAATSVVRLPVLPLTVTAPDCHRHLSAPATVPRRRRQCRSHPYGRAELAWVSRLNRAAGPGDKNSPGIGS